MANLVVCSDGTWNRPEEDLEKDFPTNVLRLARAVSPSSGDVKQSVFYDWGVGSYYDRFSGGITGAGLHKNVLDGYRYIVHNYAPGDRIYLFGFSRGAYTARSLCGLINNCGIVRQANARLIAEAWKIYKSPSRKNHPDGNAAVKFRRDYSHRSNRIHFIGVWDTVGALGIPFSLMGLFESHDEFYDTKMGSNVQIARHALAIDEKREDFMPTVWTPRPGVDLKQVWFAGVHSDVGGSYPPDKNTRKLASDVPLTWMIHEAHFAGLKIAPDLKKSLTDGTHASIHQSRKHVYRFKRPLDRALIVDGKPTLIHPTVKSRYLHDKNYRPPMLKALVEEIGWDGINIGR
ncbi:DUF2235 domain-containing protein [Microbulbifer sp. YPW16]|uniref:DUF2235 domain-containing protein n=1 Tax=Microbulbifer sp. YPW16 TaxID=2904242 RepID=UPI001E4B0ACC|nr:DUF2235 domain-containing protein [Microbulbifer sp. YPW16]UHQ54164.1 DUF2235 domain-containing protein [Microbulbifer sp. YPW16]